MTPYKRLTRAVANAARRLVGDLDPAHPEVHQLWGAISEAAAGFSGETEPALNASTAEHRFIRDLSSGFLEVDASFKNLELIEMFISRFPHHGTLTTRSADLFYHFENYLHEFNILKLRLRLFTVMIRRKYRKDPRSAEIDRRMQELAREVDQVMEGINRTRNVHVHERRFRHAEFDQLAILDTLISHPVDASLMPLLRRHYLTEYRRIRIIWHGYVRENNRALDALLNLFAAHALAAVFPAPDDEVALPASIRVAAETD